MSFEHAAEDQLEERVGDVHQFEIDAATIALDAFAVLVFVIAMTGEDMQTYRRVEFFTGRPEFLVMIGGEWDIFMRRLPDQRALETGFTAAFELFDAVVDVVNRDRRNTDQTAGVGAAVIDQPVVVSAEASFLQPGVVDGE